MKSALRNDLERLRRDALSERHRHAFEAGRAKQSAIAEHIDAASVLAMLDDDAANRGFQRFERIGEIGFGKARIGDAPGEAALDVVAVGKAVHVARAARKQGMT